MAGVCEQHAKLIERIDDGFAESKKQMLIIQQALTGAPGPNGEIGLCEFARNTEHRLDDHISSCTSTEEKRSVLSLGVAVAVISSTIGAIGAWMWSKLGGNV